MVNQAFVRTVHLQSGHAAPALGASGLFAASLAVVAEEVKGDAASCAGTQAPSGPAGLGQPMSQAGPSERELWPSQTSSQPVSSREEGERVLMQHCWGASLCPGLMEHRLFMERCETVLAEG